MYDIEWGSTLKPIGRPAIYPWHDMEVSTMKSFFIPGFPDDNAKLKRTWNSVSSCRCKIQKTTGKKFSIRRDRDDLGREGLRVWRVK